MAGQHDFRQPGSDLSRRQALHVAGAAALVAGAAVAWSPRASADPMPSRIDDDEALERSLPALSNWGRWGPDDQIGTLNFITAQTRLAAATLIRTGRVVPIGREFDPSTPELREFSYEMRSYDDPLPEEAGSFDLPLGTAIMPADLDAAAALHAVTVGEGDIVFVRTGAGPQNTYRHASGLHASCLPWLRDRSVAVLSSDSDSDVHPAAPGFETWPEPIHMVGIPYMGLTLLDQAELDAVAVACAQERRWEFFVTAEPWRMKGATGGVVTPLALF